MTAPRLRVGTSGYVYGHWKGTFYPRGLPPARWFEHYTRHFDTVEINNTFYKLPEADTFAAWRARAPRDFCYALKFSRYGSHMKRLKDPREPLRRFTARARRLGPHLGPILVQLPPRWNADPGRLDAFLRAAPRDLRWAVEFRDPSWLVPEVFDILRHRGAALCVHDLLPGHPRIATAPFTYHRFHGEKYGGRYAARALAAAADGMSADLAAGRDVFAYFNNDAHGFAPENAAELKRRVLERPMRRDALRHALTS